MLSWYHSLGFFFFWGYVKDRVYETPVPDLATVHRRIVAFVHIVDVAMMKHLWMELEYRFDILRATRGAHVE